MTYIAVGQVIRAHGLDGKVVVELPDVADDQLAGILFWIKDERGDLTPYRVMKAERQAGRKQDMFFVKFENVDARTRAEQLVNRQLHIDEQETELPRMPQAQEISYTGYRVVDEFGQPVGEVVDHQEMPAQDLIEISANEAETMLVPVIDEYVRDIDDHSKVITVQHLDRFRGLE